MSRKIIVRNIAYDDAKDRYYLTLRRENGGKFSRTFRSFAAAQEAQSSGGVGCTLTLEGWLNTWMDEIVRPNRAAATIYAYDGILKNHLLPLLGKTPLALFSPMAAQHYYAQMAAKGLSGNSIRKHHVLLHTALACAVREGLLRENCMAGVTQPRYVAPQRSYYDTAQLAELFLRVEGLALEPAVKLAGYLGLRRSEICGLRWENVDLARGILHVCEARTAVGGVAVEKGPKTESSRRRLALNGAILQLLLALREQQAAMPAGFNPRGFLLVTAAGAPYPPDSVSAWFSRFVRENGLPPLTLHGLRHSFASIANSRKASLFDIGKALGHSNSATTGKIYTHLFDDTHSDVLGEVAGAICANS